MAADGTGGRRAARAFTLSRRMALCGLAVLAIDRLALAEAAPGAIRPFETPPDAWVLAARHDDIAATCTLWVVVLFAVPAVLFAGVALLLKRGSPAATAIGRLLLGLCTPLYLGCLLGVAFVGVPSDWGGEFPEMELATWYAPVRGAVLGAAALAHLAGVHRATRAGAGRRTAPAPAAVPLAAGHLALAGLNMTVLTMVAVDQARRIARLDFDPARHASTGESYLTGVADSGWVYAALLAAAAVALAAPSLIAWRAGVSAPLLVWSGAVGCPILLLMVVTSLGMPFFVAGGGGEPVPAVISDGPPRYLPATIVQSCLGGLAYLAVAVLLVRTAARHPAARRSVG
ncbi:hypothetical protein Sru01_27950 [Sphaerisporangium rufum]|uniref:Uncharacterized protein n=1 Tax=Sphaerisporangium rufum TaxID=1381558 RepID=A0A919R2E9_9ACTN|nr:hypothetical protein [Sphaerisporangium rufum]GII77813.1 hypothetical protein Sru01_27950 [Sphaerisporangium rufum]